MENDNLLTKTCPYCGETIEFDIFKDVVDIGEDSIGTKCSNCHKVIDVTEEFDGIKFKLTPEGIMFTCLMKIPELSNLNDNLLSEYSNKVFKEFMEGMEVAGYINKID